MAASLTFALAVVDQPGRVAHQLLGRLDVDRHVRQHEADRLQRRDRLAERLALHRIAGGLVQRPPRDAHGRGRHGRPRAVKHLHGDQEAVAIVPQPILRRHAHVLQHDLARPGGVLAHLGDRLAAGDARPVALDDERAHASVLGRGIGLGEDDEEAGDRRVGDPGLGAVEDILVALAHRGAEDARHIGAGRGLGEGVGRQLSAIGQPGQVAFLLIRAAGQDDRPGREVVEHDGGLNAGAGPGQLLVDDALLQHAQAGAAVRFRDIGADQAGLLRLADDRPRKLIGLIIVLGGREDLLLGEVPRHLADHLLLFGQIEAQHQDTSVVLSGRRRRWVKVHRDSSTAACRCQRQ